MASSNLAKRPVSCLAGPEASKLMNKRACLGGGPKTISVTPPPVDDVKYFIDAEDEDEDEDDWSFYGVSKQGRATNSSSYLMVPPSPPPIHQFHNSDNKVLTSDDEFYDSSLEQKSMNFNSKPNERNDTHNNNLNDYIFNDLRPQNQSVNHRSNPQGLAPKRKRSSSTKKRPRHTIVAESDIVARQRCFDYLVTAIDEVWAQYCDCTSSEVEFFGEEDALPRSPISLYGDEDEDFKNGVSNQDSISETKAIKKRQEQLMNLKKRLLNAKYFFSDLVDSKSYDSCVAFWRRWDLVKYSTIDLVEDTDDDDVVEQVCEELEEGRVFYGYRD